MRILWHSAHPMMPTGYGMQTRLLLPRFQALGHQVAVSCTGGVESHMSSWRDIPIFPMTPYCNVGEDVVVNHYRAFEADIVFTLLCTWILEYPQVWREMRTVHLTPVDCDPFSYADYDVIANTGGTPAAISRFGERMMRAGGPGRVPLEPLYLPHGVDTSVFAPPDDRTALRAALGIDGDTFIVGMNFMNNDRFRKNIKAAFDGFARFHVEHPDSVLAVHAIKILPEGFNLLKMAEDCGIADAVAWSTQYELLCGMFTPAMLADWYGACDVVLNIGNEGFGLPAVEAQACGTPVILGDWSTGPDLVGNGWLVTGGEDWNEKHRARWGKASADSVAEQLEAAYKELRGNGADARAAARAFAMSHDIGKVVREHWDPVLSDLG